MQYPNAQLRLVACELRHRLAPGVELQHAARPFYEWVEEGYPLEGPAPGFTFRVESGPDGQRQTVQAGGFRYMSRDRTESVTVTEGALTIETTAYSDFARFRTAIERAIHALAGSVKVPAIERVGLRYIDEFELSSLPNGSIDEMFSEAIAGGAQPLADLGVPAEFLTTSSWLLGEDRVAVLRAGIVSQPVVVGTGPLRAKKVSEPPLFLIDTDCAWTSDTTPPLSLDADAILTMVDELHTAVDALFENTITDRLRNEVLMKDPVTP